MLVVTCIEKIRHKNGVITHYKLRDNNGVVKIVTAKQLKTAMMNGLVQCNNLKIILRILWT